MSERTYTHRPRVGGFDFDPTRTYEQVGEMKPRGLWLSVDGDWERWLTNEGYTLQSDPWWWGDRVCVFEVDEQRLLVISTSEQLDQFAAEYGAAIPNMEDSKFIHLIDWPRLASEHAGIVIAPYQWGNRLGGRHAWYYGWDCASACVWDLSAVTLVSTEQMSEP